jgi:hypothetical protein
MQQTNLRISSGMLRCMALVRTDVSEEHIALIIRVTRLGIVIELLWLLVTNNSVPSSPILFTMKMETIRSSETWVLTRSTRLNIPHDGILHSHSHENLKSYSSELSACVGFEVLTAVVMNAAIFWYISPCSSYSNPRFGRTYDLHHQSRKLVYQPACSRLPATRRNITKDDIIVICLCFCVRCVYMWTSSAVVNLEIKSQDFGGNSD